VRAGVSPAENSDTPELTVRANHWSPAPGHVVTFGTVGELHPRLVLQNYDLEPFNVLADERAHSGVIAGYAEDERRLGTRVILTAGGRVDRYSDFDPVFSPRLDLVVRATPRLTWKLLAGSAFRAPSINETDYSFTDQIPNPTLGPERVTTIESELAVVRVALPPLITTDRDRASSSLPGRGSPPGSDLPAR
jgi:hypothetical protein